MIALISIIVLGFFLGVRHATDPDHVIAVTTIVSRERGMKHAVLIGALWGLGHTLTILLVGSAIILFGVVIPPRIGLTMEMSVGLMLILLGVMNLSGVMRWITENVTPAGAFPCLHAHSDTHAHGDFSHASAHLHELEAQGNQKDADAASFTDRVFGSLGVYQAARPLVVGIVHGLAGSAAIALLVLTTLRDPVWGVVYLLIFGVGTIAGMMLITAAIAVPFAYSQLRFARVNRSLAMASGAISVGFGLLIVYQMGYGNGLLGAHPAQGRRVSWTNH